MLNIGAMGKFRRVFIDEHGFTLVEILLVVAILGILATVLVPRLSVFMTNAHVAAANEEVVNVEKAAQAYYCDNGGQRPPNNCNTDLLPEYLNKETEHYNYEFNSDCLVVVPDGQVSAVDSNVKWNEADHIWEKD